MSFGLLAAIERALRIVNEGKSRMLEESGHRPQATERDAFDRLLLPFLKGARQ